jgi:hypothetical protein
MAAALHGNLQDFGIAEVFQLVGQQRKTGILEVTHSGRALSIHFHEGSVVVAQPRGAREHDAVADMLVRCGLITRERAEAIARDSAASARSYRVVAIESGDVPRDEFEQIVDLLTQEVIFEVLRFSSGEFHFSSCHVEHDRSPDRLLGAEQILMEGLRMVDEWNTFAGRAPSPDQVLGRCGTLDEYRRRAGRDGRAAQSHAERIFQLVDGRLPVGRIIDLSRIGTFEGTRAVGLLLDAGVVEVTDSARAPVVASERGGAARLLSGLGLGLAAIVPLALLAGVLWAGSQRWLVPTPIPGTPIEIRPVERAAAAFETRRLRQALEAHRHLFAEWPRELAAVDRTGWSGSGALAAPQVDSYYYARRGDGVLLLPPDPGSGRSRGRID